MGDRANIGIILDEEDSVFLYTHWQGCRIEDLAREGLAKAVTGGRADDGPYCARIVAESFFAAHTAQGADVTGAGLSAKVTDGRDNVLFIYIDNQTVVHGDETWTISEFVNLVPAR